MTLGCARPAAHPVPIPPPASVRSHEEYVHAVDRVMSLADFERGRAAAGHGGFHLQRMSLLLERFDEPHLAVPTIHVAGTKGKGSVSAMMASVLAAGGHRTGLYTSPHLHTVRERIRVDGAPVTEAEFAGLVNSVWPAVREVGEAGGYGGVSTFEMMTLMAFLHFRQVAADVQVIEVGLGGRLDSTNVVRPAVSVITPISLDHTATLGGTVGRIAAEKAGIIKPGVPVVVAPQPPSSGAAMTVIRDAAARAGAEVVEVESEAVWETVRTGRDAQELTLGVGGTNHGVTLPLLGPHQAENAATAVVALRTAGCRFMPDAGAVVSGLGTVDWPGRIEYLDVGGPDDGRVVVVDGAHNGDSMDRLLESLPQLRIGGTVLVFGAVVGHSAADMLRRLSSLDPRTIIVRSRHPKAAPSASLAAAARSRGVSVVTVCDSVGDGMREAMGVAGPGDVTLVTGSISVAAEAREWAMGIEPECYPNLQRMKFPAVAAASAAGFVPDRSPG